MSSFIFSFCSLESLEGRPGCFLGLRDSKPCSSTDFIHMVSVLAVSPAAAAIWAADTPPSMRFTKVTFLMYFPSSVERTIWLPSCIRADLSVLNLRLFI
jgi:hypothetical protein